MRVPELMAEEDRHVFVLEGGNVRPIDVEDAVDYWRKRLDKK